jgi:4-amino-4-deoxy-L-arabinose transferase-like glycosyltransferase
MAQRFEQQPAEIMTDVSTFPTGARSPLIRRPKKPLATSLLVLAFLAHAILLVVVIPKMSYRLQPFYNQEKYADGYDQLAANLAEGNGYRMYPDTAKTLMREPGYPILLAGIFSTFGNNFTVVKTANMIMAFAVAWLMTLISRELSQDLVMILGPPLMFLFHPAILIAESRGGIEVMYTLFLALFMCMLYASIKSDTAWRYATSGGVLGLTLLVRGVPILFPVFVLVYLLIFERQRNRNKLIPFRNIALMIVAMFVALSPWIIRNYRLTGKFVPTASVLGVSAQSGEYAFIHNSGDDDRFRMDRDAAAERNELARALGYPFKEGYYQCFFSTGDELKFSSYLFQRVAGDYKKSPELFMKVITTNLGQFWIGGKTGDSVKMNMAVQLPLLILAGVGVVSSARNGQLRVIAPMILLIVYSMAVSAPILAQARYSVPMIPYVAILACIPLLTLRRRVSKLSGA